MPLRRILFNLLAAVVMLGVPAAYGVQPDEIMSDSALEARARDLSRELRCMVCQNQSIDDSEAPLARDLRLLVRERIAAGDSDAQVMDFLVARYGEFVLPAAVGSHTLLLWRCRWRWQAARCVMVGVVRGLQRENPSALALSTDEEARVRRLMAGEIFRTRRRFSQNLPRGAAKR